MKILGVTIHNIGPIADAQVPFDHPLILFYGAVMQGKSSILNAIKWCFGGKFPDDIIRHGCNDASVQIDLSGDSFIRREWYVARDGKTKSRDLVYKQGGKDVPRPVDKIRAMLNPFTLDQDHLRRMNDVDRKRFFVDLFGVDTSDLDAENDKNQSEASKLRGKIESYGDIDTTPVSAPDLKALESKKQEIINNDKAEKSKLQEQRDSIVREHESKRAEAQESKDALIKKYKERCAEVAKTNSVQANSRATIAQAAKRVREIKEQIAALNRELEVKTHEAAAEVPLDDEMPEPPNTLALDQIIAGTPDTQSLDALINRPCDLSEINAQISDAKIAEEKKNQWLERCKRQEAKDADLDRLRELEHRRDTIKKEKAARLSGVSETCGIPGLVFTEDGDFTFEDAASGMLSDSQMMRLTAMLSSKYPEGLALDLIDRGESLGKSVLELVAYAKDKNRTVLTTVVGDKPAEVPDGVGVWVVEKGNVSPA